MPKEYLKMTDVFPFAIQFDSDGGIGAVVDSQGEYIIQAMENNYCSHMTNRDKNEYRNKIARYVSHAVASHDELVHQRDELLDAMSQTLAMLRVTSHGPSAANKAEERMLSMYPDLEEAEIKETKKGLVLTGWYRLDKNYYLYDRADAEKAQ